METREKNRLLKMWEYESDSRSRGFLVIAGVDEAGRGPLAGPVVAAAVILPPGVLIEDCDDSKALASATRQKVYQSILNHPEIKTGIGIVSHEEIDAINILRATVKAMTLAIENLPVRPDCVLIDGLSIPDLGIENRQIIKGDSKSISIAAASIIAKETRDGIMHEYDRLYTQYKFARHKGYGTKEHIEMLDRYGPCPIHRKSFIPVRDRIKEPGLWQKKTA